MKTILLGLLSLSTLALLTGCGEEAKTKEYYSQHIEEAKTKVETCKKLEKSNEVQQLDCQNAKSAIFENKENRTNPFDHSTDQNAYKLPGAK